jgi:hypothetical protein
MLASIRLAVARSTRSDRSCFSRGSNDRENDLAAHVSIFYLLQGKSGLLEGIEVVDDHSELSGIDQARNAPQQFSFRRSTVPQRAQKAAPIDSDTLSSRGNQRYEAGLSCWIIVNRS